MSEQQNRGCWSALFGLFGGMAAPKTEVAVESDAGAPAYRVRADFLSPAELAFFRSLVSATAGRFAVFPKVNLGDVFFSPTGAVSDRNRIDRKHIDFLVTDAATFRPVLGVELDDSSHTRGKAAERDAVKDAVFESADLPLLRVSNRAYTSVEILDAINGKLGAVATLSPKVPQVTGTADSLICSNCGGEMKLRPAVPGRYAAFYGCSNYPRCRNTRQVTS